MSDLLGLEVDVAPFVLSPNVPIVGAVGEPAAGDDASTVLSQSSWTRLLSYAAVLTTSATVADRVPVLRATIADGGTVWAVPSGASVTASLTTTVCWTARGRGDGLQTAIYGDHLYLPCPDLWIPPGAKVATATAAIDAADQWSAIVVSYELAQPPDSAVRHYLQPHQAIT